MGYGRGAIASEGWVRSQWKTSRTRRRVTAQSLFTPKRFLARLMMPVIRRKFHQTQRTILDGLKQHTER